MYVVSGVTGNTGSVVADYLLLKQVPVRVLVRDAKKGKEWKEKGAEVVLADLTDPVSLVKAFKNADAAYIVKPPSIFLGDPYEEGEDVGRAVREAVQKSELKRLVVLSSIGSQLPKEVTGIIYSNAILENQLKNLKTPTVFLRAGSFMENWKPALLNFPKAQVLHSFFPLDKSYPQVSCLDIGRYAGTLMIDEWESSENSIIEIEGPHRYSPLDVAVVAGTIFKLPPRAQQLSEKEIRKVMGQMKLTPVAIEGFITMIKNMHDIIFEKNRPHVLGEVSLENGLKEIVKPTPIKV